MQSYSFQTYDKYSPLALDLHYLLTAYGAKDFQAEVLLGYAMQLLHKTPVITSEIIGNALKNASIGTTSVFSQALVGVSISDLAEQIGQIKLSPEFFNMEDTSKLWSALQTHYRPSASYLASMILIESSDTQKSEGGCSVFSTEPSIEQVIGTAQTDQLIIAGQTLVIRGKRLRGEVTRIRLGKTETLLVPEDIKETQISLLVPLNLFAGVQSIQVVQMKMGNQNSQHLIESNVAAFVLHPKITATVAQVENSGDNLRKAAITVKFHPKVGKNQRIILLLNSLTSDHPVVYSFAVAPPHENTDNITIPVQNIQPGTYLVRVQVDGAESLLHTNQTGEYDSPQVTIS